MKSYEQLEQENRTLEHQNKVISMAYNDQARVLQMTAREVENYKLCAKIRKFEGEKKQLRKNTPPFIMVYGDHLNQLELTDSEYSLLLTMSLHIAFKNKFITDGRKKLNQQAIMGLMGWKNYSYISNLLGSLALKGVIIPEKDGNDIHYLINPKLIRRGKHTEEVLFSKIFIRSVKGILPSLETNSRALLLKMATAVNDKTNTLVDENGRNLSGRGIMRLMGWKNRNTLDRALEELQKHDIISDIGKAYLVNPQYIFMGEDFEAWEQQPEIIKAFESGAISITKWCIQHKYQNANQPSNNVA